MLKVKGFPDKWIKWVQDLLGSTTTSVLLNGTVGKEIVCKRGVRQGDPLFPLLFPIAADLMQDVINHEYHLGNLLPPFPQNAELPFPIIQYVDDTIVIMQGVESQLLLLKEILHKIFLSSGLKVNYHKSCPVPINIESDQALKLAEAFGCLVGSFPFTYLGLPMGLTKPQVRDYSPLISRIERKLSASSQFLSYAGRLQLINSVLSSLPTYYMCSLKSPVNVIEAIDKFRKKLSLERKGFQSKEV
jgi:hypothetical protein